MRSSDTESIQSEEVPSESTLLVSAILEECVLEPVYRHAHDAYVSECAIPRAAETVINGLLDEVEVGIRGHCFFFSSRRAHQFLKYFDCRYRMLAEKMILHQVNGEVG